MRNKYGLTDNDKGIEAQSVVIHKNKTYISFYSTFTKDIGWYKSPMIFVTDNSNDKIGYYIKPFKVEEQEPGYHIAINPNTNKLYATDGGRVEVLLHVIDTISEQELATIVIPDEPYGRIFINPKRNKIYISAKNKNGDKKLYVIDGETNNTDAYSVPGELKAINLQTNQLYIENKNFLTILDEITLKEIRSIQLTDDPAYYARRVEVNEVTNKIYVLVESVLVKGINDALYVIDGNSNVINSMVIEEELRDFTDIAINSITNKIYISSMRNKQYGVASSLIIVDGNSQSSDSTITSCDECGELRTQLLNAIDEASTVKSASHSKFKKLSSIIKRIVSYTNKIKDSLNEETKCKQELPLVLGKFDLSIQLFKTSCTSIKDKKCADIIDEFLPKLQSALNLIKTFLQIDRNNDNVPDICLTEP